MSSELVDDVIERAGVEVGVIVLLQACASASCMAEGYDVAVVGVSRSMGVLFLAWKKSCDGKGESGLPSIIKFIIRVGCGAAKMAGRL